MQIPDTVHKQDMKRLLNGVSMTLHGIAPATHVAQDMQRLLARFSETSGVRVDRVDAIINRYAQGASVARDDLIAAMPQWKTDAVPVLRARPASAEDIVVERGEAPRG